MSLAAVYPDVLAAGITALAGRLAARDEGYAAGARVRSHAPGNDADVPLVQLGKDSDAVTYPIVSRATLRVSVWHRDAGSAHDLALLCQALLLSDAGPTIEAAQSLTGPIPGRDEQTGLDFATFTVAATVHARPL